MPVDAHEDLALRRPCLELAVGRSVTTAGCPLLIPGVGIAAMDFSPADPVSVGLFVALMVLVLASIVLGGRVAAARTGQSRAAWTVRFTGLLAAWVALTSAIVLSGVFSGDPFPVVPLFFAFVLAGAVAFALSRFGALLASGVPIAGLVAFQAFRLPLELVLHAWSEQGTIPETMTWTGQNWDIVAGVLAIVMAPFARRSRSAALVFNVIGLLLLLNVLRVVVMSSPLPFAWEVDPPLLLIAHMPYALIGPVLVASALAGHIVLFRALWSVPNPPAQP
jgi:hypothetical protein